MQTRKGAVTTPQKGYKSMKLLNLTPKNEAEQRIKEYLEQNASDSLAEKINKGVQITKNGKTLVSKKNLDGFMSYATVEARKIAEKGARSACIEDNVVFGWAIHYFEEDSIEGTLYNEDGTEYKTTPKPKDKPKTPTKTAKKPITPPKAEPPKQAPTPTPKTPQKQSTPPTNATSQLSIFDLF